jgi:hypothetical protein
VFDRYGDIQAPARGELGPTTRGHGSFPSSREWGETAPAPQSTVKDDNALLTVDLTNPDLPSMDR